MMKGENTGGVMMAVVKASSADVDLMARLLRAEAEGEGKQGMLLVGNVGINRVRANCSDFKYAHHQADGVSAARV